MFSVRRAAGKEDCDCRAPAAAPSRTFSHKHTQQTRVFVFCNDNTPAGGGKLTIELNVILFGEFNMAETYHRLLHCMFLIRLE